MAITDEIRKAFDDCTVMAGVENDFECVYITKAAALLYLDEIDAKYAKLRELVNYVEQFERFGCDGCPLTSDCHSTMLYDPRCIMRKKIGEMKKELGIDE